MHGDPAARGRDHLGYSPAHLARSDNENVLELTFNHDGSTYELGTGYGHIAVGVDDLDDTLARLQEQGISAEREPYRVREGGSRICFVRDPDEYRIELIDRSGK